jgi:hypothetical protein
MFNVVPAEKLLQEDMKMADAKLTTIQQIKQLREQEAKLVETAKAAALAHVQEGITELIDLGFHYELIERGARKATGEINHSPKDAICPICNFKTNPSHDRRSHKSIKTPFTDAQLAELRMTKVA